MLLWDAIKNQCVFIRILDMNFITLIKDPENPVKMSFCASMYLSIHLLPLWDLAADEQHFIHFDPDNFDPDQCDPYP